MLRRPVSACRARPRTSEVAAPSADLAGPSADVAAPSTDVAGIVGRSGGTVRRCGGTVRRSHHRERMTRSLPTFVLLHESVYRTGHRLPMVRSDGPRADAVLIRFVARGDGSFRSTPARGKDRTDGSQRSTPSRQRYGKDRRLVPAERAASGPRGGVRWPRRRERRRPIARSITAFGFVHYFRDIS